MPPDDKSSPPTSATEKAKARAAAKQGAPPIPPTAAPPQGQPIDPSAPPVGVPMREVMQPPVENPPVQRRSDEEVRADMRALEEGIKRHQAQQDAEQAPSKEKPPEEPQEEEEDLDDAWLGGFGDKVSTILDNKARRKQIEARIQDMDVEDLIMHGEVRQLVPIIPGKLEVTFRSITAEEDLGVKKMMWNVEGTSRYVVDRFSLMNLCLALQSISTSESMKEMDEHFDKETGRFSEELFEAKFQKMLKKPLQLLADLVVNYIWFDERVRRLLVAEELGNG